MSDSSVTPWTARTPLSMGFPRQEYWSELPFPYPWAIPNPGNKPGFPSLQEDSLLTEPPGKPPLKGLVSLISNHETIAVLTWVAIRNSGEMLRDGYKRHIQS